MLLIQMSACIRIGLEVTDGFADVFAEIPVYLVPRYLRESQFQHGPDVCLETSRRCRTERLSSPEGRRLRVGVALHEPTRASEAILRDTRPNPRLTITNGGGCRKQRPAGMSLGSKRTKVGTQFHIHSHPTAPRGVSCCSSSTASAARSISGFESRSRVAVSRPTASVKERTQRAAARLRSNWLLSFRAELINECTASVQKRLQEMAPSQRRRERRPGWACRRRSPRSRKFGSPRSCTARAVGTGFR